MHQRTMAKQLMRLPTKVRTDLLIFLLRDSSSTIMPALASSVQSKKQGCIPREERGQDVKGIRSHLKWNGELEEHFSTF